MTGDTLHIEILGKVLNNVSSESGGATHLSILDTLDIGGYCAQHSHLVSGKAVSLALEISHLETQLVYHVKIHESR